MTKLINWMCVDCGKTGHAPKHPVPERCRPCRKAHILEQSRSYYTSASINKTPKPAPTNKPKRTVQCFLEVTPHHKQFRLNLINQNPADIARLGDYDTKNEACERGRQWATHLQTTLDVVC